MKKVETIYSFTEEDEHISIKVNEECDNPKLIWIEEHPCWREPEEAIAYYEWVADCIKKLSKTL